MEESKDSHSHQFLFLILVILFDALGIGLIRPVIPNFIETVIGASGASVSLYFGFTATAFLVSMFLAGPIVGKLSDSFGRRPVLLLALLGSAINYFICSLATSATVLITTQIAAGACGSTVAIASAYALDFTPTEKRAQTLGLLWAAFGIGITIGPAIGGLLGKFGPVVPFQAAGALAIANSIYGFLVLKESLPAGQRLPMTPAGLNPITSMLSIVRQNKYRIIVPAFALLVCGNGASDAVSLLFPRLRFGWGVGAIGLLTSAYSVATAVGQAGLTPFAIKWFGEQRTILWGLASKIIGFALLAFVTQGWQMYVLIPFAILGGVVQPTIIALFSNDVGPEMQGQLQGAISSLSVVCNAIGIFFVTAVFGFFTSGSSSINFAGAGYLLAAVLASLSLVTIFRNTKSIALTVSSRSPKAVPTEE